MVIDRLVVGSLDTNCYVLCCEETGQGAVVDPGADADRILEVLSRRRIDLVAILLTHGHFDHAGASDAIKRATGAPLYLHRLDFSFLSRMASIAAFFGASVGAVPEVDFALNDGDNITFGRESVRVLHTPGHSPGGVSFEMKTELFSGDSLFAGTIGRTDFEGGSIEDLLRSIKSKLLPLADGVRLHPGHGPGSTIGQERLHNRCVAWSNQEK